MFKKSLRNKLVLIVGLVGLVTSIPALTVNQSVPQKDVTLKSTLGSDVALKDLLKAEVGTVVIFIGTQCPYSNAYNGRYNELAEALSKKNVHFVTINSNDTEAFDRVKEHAAEKKYSFPVYKDDFHKTADLFGAEHTPEAFLLDKNLKVVYHGRIDDDTDGKKITRRDLMVAAEELAANPTNPKISHPEEKAFGCTIKRK
jgi:thiol-disulfide isomerase/thioredoxin